MNTLDDWLELFFDERQRKEIAFACLYARDFNHGTDGHNSKLIIAKMADLLNKYFVAETKPVEPV